MLENMHHFSFHSEVKPKTNPMLTWCPALHLSYLYSLFVLIGSLDNMSFLTYRSIINNIGNSSQLSTEYDSNEEGIGIFGLQCWLLLDRFFSFCAKRLWCCGFGVHNSGLQMFRFLLISICLYGFGIQCGFWFVLLSSYLGSSFPSILSVNWSVE